MRVDFQALTTIGGPKFNKALANRDLQSQGRPWIHRSKKEPPNPFGLRGL
jgi:hypothetical protein